MVDRRAKAPVLAGAILATWLALASTARTADLSTFVKLPGGFIIGSYSEGKWLPSEQAGKALQPGGKYRVFTLAGELSKAIGGKAAPNADVCPDVWQQEVTPATEMRAICFTMPLASAPGFAGAPRRSRSSRKTKAQSRSCHVMFSKITASAYFISFPSFLLS